MEMEEQKYELEEYARGVFDSDIQYPEMNDNSDLKQYINQLENTTNQTEIDELRRKIYLDEVTRLKYKYNRTLEQTLDFKSRIDELESRFERLLSFVIAHQGERGEHGMTGERGLAGPAGERGLAGIAGVDGLAGIAGVDGLAGIAGEQGVTGERGVSGKKGDTGSFGRRGHAGFAGNDGRVGKTGANGKDGKDGKNAKDGADGKSESKSGSFWRFGI
jgi:hypothetical protein